MHEVTVAGRAAAEGQMQDVFTAYAPGGKSTNADGYEVDGFTSQGATVGKVSGRSREGDTQTRTVNIGGSDRPIVEGGLHVPLSAPMPTIGWEYECTAVGPGSDPGLLGRRYRVVDVPLKSYATARRLDVVDVTGS
jgi:hypothetical protein